VTLNRLRRRPVIVVLLAFVVLGLVGVNAWAFVGHDTPRVVASPTAARHPADLSAHASGTTTTVKPASTPTVIVATTVPSTTTNPPRYVPPPTPPTTHPTTVPPTTAAPTTTTVATTASLHITPSTAEFPSTPPPYWPMPIVPVTITNTGGVVVNSVVVHPVGVYSIPSNTCTTTLMPGQSCSAQVQFCPTSPGHYVDTLLVTGQDAVARSPLQANITLDGTAS
jgi:cytoskeletal protein RodZ